MIIIMLGSDGPLDNGALIFSFPYCWHFPCGRMIPHSADVTRAYKSPIVGIVLFSLSYLHLI